MREKIRLGVLFGGRSCEHEVSVTSARSMLAAIDATQYDVTLIGIGKDGRWHVAEDVARLPAMRIVDGEDLVPVLLDYSEGQALLRKASEPKQGHSPGLLPTSNPMMQLDVVFPLLHGPFGEDGTVQGLLELAGLPYVGSGVVGSAVGMDKAMMKRVFRAEGLPLLDYQVIPRSRLENNLGRVRQTAEEKLGYPMFVKPASLGSSVGVHRIGDATQFQAAVLDAASFDEKVILEAAAPHCREIECAVLGNDDPRASVLGEIEPSKSFYDYEAKYADDSSRLSIPANLSAQTAAKIQHLALEAFIAVDAKGLARVDFFVDAQTDAIYVNEINTMPGFTPISMYPKLWHASGIAYPALIDELIALAFQRHVARQSVRASL